MNSTFFLVAAMSLAASMNAYAVSNADDPVDRIIIAAADTAETEGEVRKVDPETRKITIRHGAIRNLDMPAMTMVFQVKDPAMIEKVKAGDKVVFRADKINGIFTVMEIEVVK